MKNHRWLLIALIATFFQSNAFANEIERMKTHVRQNLHVTADAVAQYYQEKLRICQPFSSPELPFPSAQSEEIIALLNRYFKNEVTMWEAILDDDATLRNQAIAELQEIRDKLQRHSTPFNLIDINLVGSVSRAVRNFGARNSSYGTFIYSDALFKAIYPNADQNSFSASVVIKFFRGALYGYSEAFPGTAPTLEELGSWSNNGQDWP